MSYTRNANTCFLMSKMHAKERNIAFKFTKAEWIKWWKDNLGIDWMQKRGCKRGQYVMARNGDAGAYEISNVRCVLSSDNHKERKQNGNHSHGVKHPRCKLTEPQVMAIRTSQMETKELADIYGISVITIRDIRARRRWKHLA